MLDAVFQPYPQYLSHEELVNPFSVINDLFADHDLDEARKWMAGWIGFANKKKVWNKTAGTYLLTFCEAMNKLIEAAWVIQQKDNSERLANLTSAEFDEAVLFRADFYCNRHFRDDPWNDFPRSLKRKEYLNPYIVFDKIFQFRGLALWKEYLYTLLHTSLSGNDLDGDELDILNIKEYLDKLIEASHLIHLREFEWVNYELVPKTKLTITNKRNTNRKAKE